MRPILRYLLWLLAFPAEAAAGWLLLNPGGPRVAVALLVHAAAGLFGLSLRDRKQDGGRGGVAWALVGWTLALVVFPLLGMAAAAVAFLLSGRGRRDALAGIKAAVEGGEEPDVVARAREVEVSLLDEREIEPVVDVLHEDDPEAKRAAIEALTRGGAGSDTVRLLRGLLHDPSPEARLFASLALSRLEDEIGKSILQAQEALAEAPDSPQAREDLARLYLDYVLGGFLQGAAAEHYLRLAKEAFERAMEVHEDPDSLVPPLARTHLMLGEIPLAAALLDELAEKQPPTADVHLLRMDVAYRFGSFREVSVYARRALADFPEGEPEARALAAWWAGEEADAPA